VSRPAPAICLITPGHLASTPRLVKNADALAAAGYRVHVVAGRNFVPAERLDTEVLAAAKWSHTLINHRRGAGAAARKICRRLARWLLATVPAKSVRLAARAHHAEALHLARVAARQPAQLYFGHCLAGLPAAAFAAGARGVAYGFDAEDFHDAETIGLAEDRVEAAARHRLQSRLLPGSALFTTASPLISRQYEISYGAKPQTLLNVFPLAQAPAAPVDPGPVSETRPARLYWFSQTIGPGRGLEAAIAVLGRMRTPTELHLRGFVAGDYRARLESLAATAGRAGALRFLAPAPPAEMVHLAADADLGLSLEETRPLNRDLCLTNKVFAYLMAGVPQLLSNTTAQRNLAPELGAAAQLVDPGAVDATARQLDVFLADSARVAVARRAAWDLARRRYCWEIEQRDLLDAIRRLVGPPT